ncbi:MAG: hypothetical protein JST22_09920 [Bacteroidetes bacterium]|nr:hypothetical protein [Bacteroidota bacterium]
MSHDTTAIMLSDRPSNKFWERVSSTDREATTGTAKLWSADAMIDAWLLGKEEAEKERHAMTRKLIAENLERTATITRTILEALKGDGIWTWRVYLNLETIFDYELLVVVDEAPFVSDKFASIYNLVGDIEERERSDTYRPAIHFMPIPKGKTRLVDRQALEGDGYIYRFKEAASAKSARAT